MAILSTRCLVLAMVMIIGTLVFSDTSVSAQCGKIIPGLASQCSSYVAIRGPKIPPSPKCCSLLKSADIPCVCGLVTPEIEKIISMEKVVYVAKTCGINVPPGMKCGSYTVPPARLI